MNQLPDNQWKSQVINAGFAGGLSTDSQYLYLREIRVRFSPDVVIVGFCVINDLLDISTNRWVLDKEGRLQEIYNRMDRIISLACRRMAIATALLTYLKPKEVMDKREQALDRTALDRVKFALSGMQATEKEKGIQAAGAHYPSTRARDREGEVFCLRSNTRGTDHVLHPKSDPFFRPLERADSGSLSLSQIGKNAFQQEGE